MHTVGELLGRLTAELIKELSQRITGKLLTEKQIQVLSKGIVGEYLSDLLPTTERDARAEERISNAKMHITEATNIITGLQDELEKQADQLDLLSKEIVDKKQVADRYATLAQANETTFSAFKAEMEETVRKELTAQAENGKRIRMFVSLLTWAITLVIGAGLGAWLQIYMEPIVEPSPKQSQIDGVSVASIQ